MRFHPNGEIFFVTNRTEEERFFLLPRPKIVKLVGAWLARALHEHGDGIELFAFVFLSNHYHLLLRDTKGQLAQFIWYFQLNLAKAVNREHRRYGHFFGRHYDAAPVKTDQDFENRYAYVVCNAVKARLVARAKDGPFFSSLDAALRDTTLCFTWLDRTAKHNKSRRGQKADDSTFEKSYEIRLAVPPIWQRLSTSRRGERIAKLVQASEARYGQERRAEGQEVLGAKRILAQSPFMRPKSPARRPRVRLFCCAKELEREYLETLRVIRGLYREAYDGFLKAAHKGRRSMVEWPPGCYPPSSMRPVPLAA